MNWKKPREEITVSEVADGDDMEDRCVCCGDVIPEGTMVCQRCFVNENHIQTNYDRILAMNITQLAEFICENTKECGDCKGYDYCVADAGHGSLLSSLMKLNWFHYHF